MVFGRMDMIISSMSCLSNKDLIKCAPPTIQAFLVAFVFQSDSCFSILSETNAVFSVLILNDEFNQKNF